MSERHTTALDLRIVQAEAKLKRSCKEQSKMEKYVEPPDGETTNERTVRRRKIRNSLMGACEEKQRLENKRIATQKWRHAIKRGDHTPTPRRRAKKRPAIMENCNCHSQECDATEPTTWDG